jgi:molecular chaperone DnaK
MEELGDKVPAADKTKLEGLIKELREAVTKEDDAEIQRLKPEVQQVLYSIGSSVYQAGDVPPPGGDDSGSGGGGTTSSTGGDDVIDAEFSESK